MTFAEQGARIFAICGLCRRPARGDGLRGDLHADAEETKSHRDMYVGTAVGASEPCVRNLIALYTIYALLRIS